jgi:exopolysaccharide production protein ExoY
MVVSNRRNVDSLHRLVDSLCIVLGYLAAWRLALWLTSRQLFVFPDQWVPEYRTFLLLSIFLWLGVSGYMSTDQSHRTERLSLVAGELLKTLLTWALAITAGVFVLKLHNISRQFMIYMVVFSGLLIAGRHVLTMAILRRLRRFGYDWRTVLVVGSRGDCERFADLLTQTHPTGYRVLVAPIDGDVSEDQLQSLLSDLPEVEDAFIIPGGRSSEPYTLKLLKEGKTVHLVPELLDARLFSRVLGDVAGIPVISLLSGRLAPLPAALKRAADLAVAMLLLIVMSPVFAAVALLVKLTSKGPVIFAQKRVGQDGKPFMLWKFRTMVQNAEQVLKSDQNLYAKYVASNYKLPKGEDPRLTSIGAFLRATSLDELPQLLNVIKGDMSLVGPRPVVPDEVQKYGDYALLFLSARPGLTGHWQVSGRSQIELYAKRVELDLEYIRDQSFGKDLEILLRTVPAVLLRKGAQ